MSPPISCPAPRSRVPAAPAPPRLPPSAPPPRGRGACSARPAPPLARLAVRLPPRRLLDARVRVRLRRPQVFHLPRQGLGQLADMAALLRQRILYGPQVLLPRPQRGVLRGDGRLAVRELPGACIEGGPLVRVRRPRAFEVGPSRAELRL